MRVVIRLSKEIKAKVVSPFSDKYRNRYYGKGYDYFHHDQKRIDDLVKKGFIVQEKEPAAAKKRSGN